MEGGGGAVSRGRTRHTQRSSRLGCSQLVKLEPELVDPLNRTIFLLCPAREHVSSGGTLHNRTSFGCRGCFSRRSRSATIRRRTSAEGTTAKNSVDAARNVASACKGNVSNLDGEYPRQAHASSWSGRASSMKRDPAP
jgi:hypothetical protein